MLSYKTCVDIWRKCKLRSHEVSDKTGKKQSFLLVQGESGGSVSDR